MTLNWIGKAWHGKAWVYSAPVILLLNVTNPAMAAPSDACSVGIDRVQAELDATLARRATAGPTAKQSDFATMRRQPTPETVARAEAEIGDWQGATKAAAALRDARNAKIRGDQRACQEALESARDVIREAN